MTTDVKAAVLLQGEGVKGNEKGLKAEGRDGFTC